MKLNEEQRGILIDLLHGYREMLLEAVTRDEMNRRAYLQEYNRAMAMSNVILNGDTKFLLIVNSQDKPSSNRG